MFEGHGRGLVVRRLPAVDDRGRASVEAEALHQGRTQQLWQIVITDDAAGTVLARGQLRLQNVALPETQPDSSDGAGR